MPEVLSRWKDIAKYLGKGVRTVPRREQSLGLPVHRASGQSQIVIAFPDEIEARLRERPVSPHSEVQQLQARVSELEAENERLRERVAELTREQSSHDLHNRALAEGIKLEKLFLPQRNTYWHSDEVVKRSRLVRGATQGR